MLRLIDADALKEKTIGHGEKIAYVVSFIWDIDTSPTIDAIPVEWLNNIMLNGDNEDSKAAWRMLHKWNNEHFADFGRIENL